MKLNVEYTDTFSGEANYSWVRRATINVPEITEYGYDSKRQRALIMRRAKAALGLSGVRGRVMYDCGEMIEWRPHGMCTVMFITWDHS